MSVHPRLICVWEKPVATNPEGAASRTCTLMLVAESSASFPPLGFGFVTLVVPAAVESAIV
ncbi:MAG: hypothetical protein DMG08_30670 [Acidobacteria bacterium]|nr:MAG: hypothetical protein DMG08_30670 [Acidobacteriota bacterium]